MSKPVTALQIEAYKTNITAHTGTSSQEERENLTGEERENLTGNI